MSGAPAQLPRLLALVPYLLARPGIRLAEVAADFGITEDQLRRDLSRVADRQRVRECVLTAIGVGLFRQVAGFHRNGELILTHGVSAGR